MSEADIRIKEGVPGASIITEAKPPKRSDRLREEKSKKPLRLGFNKEKFKAHVIKPLIKVGIATALTAPAAEAVTPHVNVIPGLSEAFGGENLNGQEISNQKFDVEVAGYPSTLNYPADDKLVPRIEPNTTENPTAETVFYGNIAGRKGRLVYGAPYPGPEAEGSVIGDAQQNRTKQVNESWKAIFKQLGVDENYWNFEKDGKNYGAWMEFDLSHPILVSGQTKPIEKLYLSLNQVIKSPEQE